MWSTWAPSTSPSDTATTTISGALRCASPGIPAATCLTDAVALVLSQPSAGREFDGSMASLSQGKHQSTIKLSSAGLVYLHFGRAVIAAMSGVSDEKTLDIIWTNLYDNFVEEIDAVDNGISQFEGESR